jgi:chromosomal replication initiation ATPase DnaA
MSARQIHLALPILPSRAEQDFYVSASNRQAVERIDAWPNWPELALALVGPASSGKSHLAAIWAERVGAWVCSGQDLGGIEVNLPEGECVLVDDADQVNSEEALLHIFNWLRERRCGLLLCGTYRPVKWNIDLPDLSSRLATVTVVEIEPPDDDLLAAVIGKQLADRQIMVNDAVIRFLVRRMERSFKAAQGIVERLDTLSLSEGRPITVPLARKVLEKLS